jgi:glycosyltransferase involved in cell wall biosynthesis
LKLFILFPKDSQALFNTSITKTFGGASAQLYNIARELHKKKELTTISIVPYLDEIIFDDAEFFNLKFFPKENENFLSKIFSLMVLIKNDKPDFILQRGLTLFSCLLAFYCKMKKIKFIFMFAHDREAEKRYQKNNKKCVLFPLLVRNSYKLIVQNNFQYEKISQLSDKTVLIKSGYSISGSYCSRFKNRTVLWISRLEPWKQPEIILKLAYNMSDTQFIVIGPVFERTKEYGETVVNQLKNVRNIKYVPFSTFQNIGTYFEESSLFLNTSIKEGFPNTFIQAAIKSLPIVSLNVNPNDFIDNYDCGYFCNNNFTELMEKLKILLTDKTIYDVKSKNSYDYAASNHDIENIAAQIYKELM